MNICCKRAKIAYFWGIIMETIILVLLLIATNIVWIAFLWKSELGDGVRECDPLEITVFIVFASPMLIALFLFVWRMISCGIQW